MIVSPEIRRTHVAPEVELVRRAVKIVGTALGDHLDAAARGAIVVRRLADCGDLEFFDALDRSRDHARGSPAGRGSTSITVARRVGRVRARHVVAVVTAVELILVLVRCRTGDVARQGYTHLENRQRRSVAAEVRQQLQRFVRHGGADRCVQRLERRPGGRQHFHCRGGGAHLQRDVQRQ